MIRLAFVKFKSLQQLQGGSTTELRPALHGEIVFLPEQQLVRVGDDLWPVSCVERMKADNYQEICPECGDYAVDARGLGAHRWQKHQVPGKIKKEKK